MQNKGAIRAIAIIFALIFVYQLSFTVVTKIVERKAEKNAIAQVFPKDANGQDIAVSESIQDAIAETMEKRNMDEPQAKNYLKDRLENSYLDSMNNVNVYNLGFKKYTYRDAKEKEINLGLDLKGGMNVTLEVSVKDIVKALSHDSQDPTFLQAMELATKRQQASKGDFVTLFGEAYKEVDPNAKLVSIFLLEFKDKKDININSSNEDVLKVLREESDAAIDRSYQILGTRIDRFGVAQPNIQKLENSGRILVELPGIKDPERVRKLLQGTAQLEFWETYNFSEIQQAFVQADAKLAADRKARKSSEETPAMTEEEQTEVTEATEEELAVAEEVEAAADSANTDLIDQLAENKDEEAEVTDEELDANHPLFSKLQPVNTNSARVGIAMVKDTAAINQMLAECKSLFPRQLKLAWTVKPESIPSENGESIEVLDLVALKMSRDNTCAMPARTTVKATKWKSPSR